MLKVVEGKKSFIEFEGVNKIIMTVRKNSTKDLKKRIMDSWYSEQLTDKLNVLVPQWEEKTGLKLSSWQIKKMKTRWGSCNVNKQSACFNLELAKNRQKRLNMLFYTNYHISLKKRIIKDLLHM